MFWGFSATYILLGRPESTNTSRIIRRSRFVARGCAADAVNDENNQQSTHDVLRVISLYIYSVNNIVKVFGYILNMLRIL